MENFKKYLIINTLVYWIFIFSTLAHAGGISFDAGLTPPKDRWILRTQVRYLQRNNDPSPTGREMSTFMFPVVLAYGYRPDLTIMVRQSVISREMSMTGTSEKKSGLGDLFILAKYRAYRLNTPVHTLGIAPTLGLEFPSGEKIFSSETWDLNAGLHLSWRHGLWAADCNVTYELNGFIDSGKNGMDPGDELSLNIAFAYQFVFGEKARSSLAPVLELNYNYISVDRLDGHTISGTGETVLHFSPGVKFTTSSLILEVLLYNPVYQRQLGTQLEHVPGVITGARFLF